MGQGKKSEDNVVAVIYKAVRHYRIRVSITSIRDYLQRHPYYPSLKSVCDAFTRWNIDYYPLKLTGDEIKSLKMPYIAHRNIAGGQLVFATNNKNNTVNYTTGANKVITEDTSNFLKGLSGAVIVYQPAEGSGEKEFRSDELQASKEILNVNKELFKKNNISGTPTMLINNHKYPGQYEITDLEYYIDDIIELLEKKKARSPHPF